MRHRRFTLVTLSLLTAALAACCAEGELTAGERQIELLRRQVDRAEAQVKAQTESVLVLDGQIEAKINDVVELLTTIGDSPDSKTRVTGVKKDIIDGLEKSIAFYRQRRATRVEALRTGSSTEPASYNDQALRFLDDKVEKRVAQILQVTASLTQHKEWKRSEKYYTSGRYGNERRQGSVETTDYRRHAKNVSRSEREKKGVAEALSGDADRLTAENKRLRQSLAYAKTDENRSRIEGQIKRNEEIAAKRKGQVRSALGTAQPPAKTLSKHAAFETERWISDMVQGIGRDHRELVRLASERNHSVAQMKSWQDRLSRAEAALAQPSDTGAR